MSIDSYDPCPCGSGKKLKFCCHAIVGDMTKVAKLQQNHQVHAADAILDKIESKLQPTDTGVAWVGISRATNRITENQHSEAQAILAQIVKQFPENIFAVAMHATTSFTADSWDKAKPIVQRAFQKCSAAHPQIVSNLAMAIAARMFGQRKYMSSRQYLTFAMRFAPEQDRQDVFVALLEFDSNRQIYYPLRSVHVLEEYAGSEERQKQALRAMKLAGVGCYSQPATLYVRLLEDEPDNAILWLNAGLCQAWDGDEAAAAKSLHRTAELRDDVEAAIEFETLAQLLDHNCDDNSMHIGAIEYPVKTVSKLLTALDKYKEVYRTDQSQHDPQVSGLYLLLDREFDADSFNANEKSWEELPQIVGQLTILDSDDEQGARAFVSAFEGERLEKACQVFEQGAGEEAEEGERKEAPNQESTRSVSKELFSLIPQFFVAPGIPTSIREGWRKAHWAQAVNEFWMNGEQRCLDGASPLDSAGKPEKKMALAAAVRVLDAFAEVENSQINLPQLCEKLQLDPPQQIPVGPDISLNLFTAAQLHRLPVQELSDQQLAYVLNRALLIHHSVFLYDVLTEVLKRPECLKNVDLERVYGTMTELCRDRDEYEAALGWIEKSKEIAQQGDNAFEDTLKIELRELMLRLDAPDNPGLSELLQRFQQFYFTKVPQLEGHLTELLKSYGVSPETLSSIVSDGSTGGGVWTPESAAQAEQSGEQKLWLPGQD